MISHEVWPLGDTVAESSLEQEGSCLRELIRWARVTPEAPAIVSPGRDPLTFRALEGRIESIAGDLRAFGVAPGDIVAISMPEGPDLLTTLLGVMRLTAAAPLDATFTEPELRTRLSLTPARCLVAGAGSHASVAARALALPVIDAHPDALMGVSLEWNETGARELPPMKQRSASSDNALILQTSATTGTPKLVPLTHRNLDAICGGMRCSLALRSDDRHLSVMPLHHVVGFSCAVGQLLEGGSVIAAGGFDALRFASLLEEFEPTWYAGGPALHRAVLQLAKAHPVRFAPNKLRLVRCGTSSASPALLDELERVLRVTVVNGYGLTEVGTVTNTVWDLPRKPGSVGRSIGPEIGVMDSAGSLLSPNTEGEVVVRGECVMPGYLGDPAASREVLRDGWFHTSDLGRLDDEGDLFITGRIKEIINRGGESIAPIEIDHALTDHPAVAQAAAFPVPHSTLGEDVAAAVVLRPSANVSVPELRSFLSTRIARSKIPNRILFVDTIPANSSGKPLRKSLTQQLLARDSRREEPMAESVPDSRTLTLLEREIAAIWNDLLPGDASGPDDDFFALGGDSLSVTRMLTAVEKEFALDGRLWERTEFHDSPTVATLARVVEECLSKKNMTGALTLEKQFENVSATLLQTRGSGPPVMFFPGESLEPWYLRHLARSLGDSQPFIAFRHQLTEPGQFEEFASRFVKLVRIIRPEGPFVLAGHCYGGILAYEVAARLQAEGETRIAVVCVNVPAPGYARARPQRYFRYLPIALMQVLRGRGMELVADIRRHFDFLREKRYQIQLGRGRQLGRVPETEPWNGSPAAIVIRSYVPRPFTGRLTHILANGQTVSTRVLEDPRLGWRRLLRGSLDEYRVNGDHLSMFEKQNAAKLAGLFRPVIQAIGGAV